MKNLFIYKGPEEYNQFELLEDEAEDQGQANPNAASGGTPNTSEAQGKSVWRKWFQGKANASASANDTEINVNKKLQINLDNIKAEFNAPTNQDVVIREFKVMQQNKAFIIYIDGMVDKVTVNDYILRQLLEKPNGDTDAKTNMVDYVSNNLLAVNQIKKESAYSKIVQQVLNGLTALFIDGCEECILIESRGFEKRSVSTPLNETVIRGPQEAFIENLRTNVTLVRRIIRNKDLVSEMLPVGKTNHMTCAILYIKGMTNPKIVAEVKRRINSIDIDFVADGGTVEQLIEDHPFSLFPQVLATERPDRTASFLMEGKMAIICDGTPYASIVPITFFDLLHTPEDYSLRWQFGTFLRIVRAIAAGFAVFLPGLFLSLILYHREMIPTELLISVAKARESVPFPTVIEMLLMELAWELIREAGVRVPGVIGQTLGIVGAIILGQAAVAAGLVSPILIIIVAITGLASFAIPNFSLGFGMRVLRFAFTFFGAIAGFYGIAAGVFIFGGLACSMKSFGVPYFSPTAPKAQTAPDLLIRTPAWLQKERPDIINPLNRNRAGNVIRGWTKQSGRGDGRK